MSESWGYNKDPANPDFSPRESDPRFGSNINPNVITGGNGRYNLPDARPELDAPLCRLQNQLGSYVDLWITSFETDFVVDGSTAQSRGYREFYPRNFSQPVVTLTGRCANDFQFNRLAEFIHGSQITHLTNDYFYSKPPLRLGLVGKDARNSINGPDGADATVPDRGHLPWLLQGYVTKIEAGGRRFNQAPEFIFEFNVVWNAYSGDLSLYDDHQALATSKVIVNWMDVIKSDAYTPKSATKATQNIGTPDITPPHGGTFF